MKYQALLVIFAKMAKYEIVVCCKIIAGALQVNTEISEGNADIETLVSKNLNELKCKGLA